ncbi:MAG: hypothetical protein LQ345_003339 [Seirophora villosa]|nr:MAG: hypothetical protein LQ345_003339 [Seirophora villosa]
MAPQTSIPISANVLGTIGTVFWCIQLLPQIWYNWKQKKTDGLPGSMMFTWAASAVPFGVYAIVQNFSIAIQIQPQVFCTLALISWSQILIYNNGWAVWRASILAAAVGALFGGLQVLLILTLRGPYHQGIEWPITLVGVVSAILLAGGLIPPYFEIAKRSGRVVGINFIFLSIDWMGAFFSLMALGKYGPHLSTQSLCAKTPLTRNLAVAQNSFDVLGGVQYLVCLLLELGIFLSHAIFLLRTRSLRRRAKETHTPFDAIPEARRFVFPRPVEEQQEHEPQSGATSATVSVAGDIDVEKMGGEKAEEEEEEVAGSDDDGLEKRREKEDEGVVAETRRERTLSAGAAAGRWPAR